MVHPFDNSRAALGVVLGVLWCSPTVYANDNDLSHRLIREAPSGWQRLESTVNHVEGSAVHSTADAVPSGFAPFQVKTRWRFKSQVDFLVFEERRFNRPKGDTQRAGACNSKYCFLLTRQSDSQPWVETGVIVDDPQTTKQVTPRDLANMSGFVRYWTASYALGGKSLSSLVREPEFRLKGVTPVQDDGKDCLAMDFEYHSKENPETRDPKKRTLTLGLESGRIVLDPARLWAITSFDIRFTYGLRLKARNRFRQGPDEIPVIQTYSEEGLPPSGPAFKVLVEFEDVVFRDSNESEFTLSAFGLPEPPGVEWKRPTRWWLWLACFGILALTLGTMFIWLKGRAARTMKSMSI
jgi:hypothetical protein